MRLHVLSAFGNAFGGTEQGIIELHRALARRCEMTLWSETAPDARLTLPVRRINPGRGEVPRGGTLLIHGNFFAPGAWLDRVQVERVILGYNTVVRADLKRLMIERLGRVRRFEIVYASQALRVWVGEPGEVLYSRIDLDRFRPVARDPAQRFTLGRLSRDVPEKHHREDETVYRHFTARGAAVRIMGGSCLAGSLRGAPGIELSPAGAEPAEVFLRSLDALFYRVGEGWTEAAGRVVAEAMASGLPVVGHRNAGYREWIEDGVSGFLFDSTAEAVGILEQLQAEPLLRSRVGAAARARMEAVFSASADEAYAQFFLQTA